MPLGNYGKAGVDCGSCEFIKISQSFLAETHNCCRNFIDSCFLTLFCDFSRQSRYADVKELVYVKARRPQYSIIYHIIEQFSIFSLQFISMDILNLIYPKLCVGCRREGQYICLDCQRKLVRPEEICPMCAKPSLDGWTHPRCRSKYGMERLIVGLPYRGMVQQCLKKVKYKSAWEILEFLYPLWQRKMVGGQWPMFDNVAITSVPMWREKERKRGFNQAEIIAQLLARDLRGLSSQVLERVRETKPMFGLDRKKRQVNIEDAFRVLHHYTVTPLPLPQNIILVDDVWTTGATMKECAKVLKGNGWKEVWGVTLAR